MATVPKSAHLIHFLFYACQRLLEKWWRIYLAMPVKGKCANSGAPTHARCTSHIALRASPRKLMCVDRFFFGDWKHYVAALCRRMYLYIGLCVFWLCVFLVFCFWALRFLALCLWAFCFLALCVFWLCIFLACKDIIALWLVFASVDFRRLAHFPKVTQSQHHSRNHSVTVATPVTQFKYPHFIPEWIKSVLKFIHNLYTIYTQLLNIC